MQSSSRPEIRAGNDWVEQSLRPWLTSPCLPVASFQDQRPSSQAAVAASCRDCSGSTRLRRALEPGGPKALPAWSETPICLRIQTHTQWCLRDALTRVVLRVYHPLRLCGSSGPTRQEAGTVVWRSVLYFCWRPAPHHYWPECRVGNGTRAGTRSTSSRMSGGSP